MKQTLATFFYLIQRWVLIFAIALSPLKAIAQNEARQLDLFEPVTGLKIAKATGSEDVSKLAATEPSEVTDPTTSEKNSVQAFYDSKSTKEERKSVSPKALMAAIATAKASPGIALETAKTFPAESLTFYSAMGALAVAEMNLPLASAGKNPAALEQFIEHSFKDPVGATGFYAFMLVNRQSGHFFEQLRMAGGTDPKNFSKVKRLFYAHGAPQIGMSAGFLAQTVFTEMYHDKEFKMCTARYGMKQINKIVGGKTVAVAPDSPEILDACEKAYDRWAVDQKIKDYVPLVAAMVATNILQMSGVPFAKWLGSKTGVTKVLMKTPGLGVVLGRMTMIVGRAGRFIPYGMLARVASMVIFIKGSELVQPFFDRTTGMPWRAGEIANVTNKFEEKIGDLSKRGWQQANYLDRKDQKENDPVEILKTLGMYYQKMRQFHLQIPLANHSNWQQALLKFQGSYLSSYAMYDRVISEVREFRERGSNNRFAGETPSGLYLTRESPIYRIGTLISKKQSGPLASDPLRELIVRIREYYLHNSKSLTANQDKVLRQLNFGLESAYRDLSANELEAAIKKAKLDSGKMSAEQRASVAAELRASRVSQAIKLFDQVGSNIKKGDGVGTLFASAMKGLFAEVAGNTTKLDFNSFFWHLYANSRSITHVVTTVGYDYYHRELGSNKDIINDMDGEGTPKRYELAYTPTMADYLLASMVCGPRAEGGAQERSQQTTLVSKAMNWWNSGNQSTKTFQKLSLVEFTPGFGWRFLPPRLVQDSIADANFCGRIPKFAKTHNIATAAEEFVQGRSVEKQNIDLRTFFNVNSGEYKVNNEVHQGMLPLVKYFMNPKFLAKVDGDAKPFYQYWTTQVEPQAKTALLEFQKNYRDIVKTDFVPRFISGEYFTWHNRKVHYGTGWSLREEGMLYHDLLKRMIPKPELQSLLNTYKRNLTLSIAMFSQSTKVRQATDIILRTFKQEEFTKSEEDMDGADILAGLEEEEKLTDQFTPQQIASVRNAADPVAQAATLRLLKAIELNMKAINDLVGKTALKGAAKNVAQQLVVNMGQVASEAETYNGVIRAVNLQGLPDVSDLQ